MGGSGSSSRAVRWRCHFFNESDGQARTCRSSAHVETKLGKPLDFKFEIRLSNLGNHYLRMERPLADASVHELNQAMRRGMAYMGEESVTLGKGGSGQGEWDRLNDLADQLIEWLVETLDEWVELDQLGRKRLTEQTASSDSKSSETRLVASKGHPHVILMAQELSISTLEPAVARPLISIRRDVSIERDASIERLMKCSVKGTALLLQPLQPAAPILEEWSRYSLAESQEEQDNAASIVRWQFCLPDLQHHV